MRMLLVIQFVSLLIIMLLAYFYAHIFRINLQNIEVRVFDFEIYAAASRSFGWRSWIGCAWTVFVGIKIRKRVVVLGYLMIGSGSLFSLLSLGLFFAPRMLTIADVYFYWIIYTLFNIGLTVYALITYQEGATNSERDYQDVLDHFDKENP